MKLALTGAGGWIGGRLQATAIERGIDTSALRARAGEPLTPPPADVMIHVGGIAHDLYGQMDEAAYRAANAELPVELARRCAEAGYRRFVFVSSSKVFGDATTNPATEDTTCDPHGAYARAKRDAEIELARLAPSLGLEVVVVRPPLVYGPGVGANFARLIRLADGPLPWLASSRPARRSLVYIDNLVDALLFLAMRPASLAGDAAAGPGVGRAAVYHVTDGPAPTVDELVGRLREALGRPRRQLRVPAILVSTLLAMPMIGHRARRLFGSLELDSHRLLAAGWRPPVAFGEAVERTVRAWRDSGRGDRTESG
ncbi:MAG: NAD-dependent epimerase/dehydratase family protein [Burkholderiaceae bacterium]